MTTFLFFNTKSYSNYFQPHIVKVNRNRDVSKPFIYMKGGKMNPSDYVDELCRNNPYL